MRYVVVTPEDQPTPTWFITWCQAGIRSLRHVHRAVAETDSEVSIPLVIGALMAMSWHIAYGLAHH